MKPYAYILVRADLPPVQIVVQASHAAYQAGFAFEEPLDITSIIILTVPDEAALLEAAARLERYRIEHRMFYEPDFGPMGNSALATQPITRKKDRFLFKDYPKLEFQVVAAQAANSEQFPPLALAA